MATAFEADAFQHDAFQMDPGDAFGRGSGGRGYSRRKKRLLDAQYAYNPDDIIAYNELLDIMRRRQLNEQERARFRQLQEQNALIAILLSS